MAKKKNSRLLQPMQQPTQANNMSNGTTDPFDQLREKLSNLKSKLISDKIEFEHHIDSFAKKFTEHTEFVFQEICRFEEGLPEKVKPQTNHSPVECSDKERSVARKKALAEFVDPSSLSDNFIDTRPHPILIGSKERANELDQKFPPSKFFYISLRSKNTSEVDPVLLSDLFGIPVDWPNIFPLKSRKANLACTVALPLDHLPAFDRILEQNSGLFQLGNQKSIQVKLQPAALFKSCIYQVDQYSEYTCEEAPIVSGRTKRLKTDEQNKPAGQSNNSSPPESNDGFLLITNDHKDHIEKTLNRFADEQRLVCIITDQMFCKPDITFKEIESKFSPLFGRLDSDCIYLAATQENLKKITKDSRGQAYLVGPKDLDRSVLLGLSLKYNILLGMCTLGCVKLKLDEGILMMSRRALKDM